MTEKPLCLHTPETTWDNICHQLFVQNYVLLSKNKIHKWSHWQKKLALWSICCKASLGITKLDINVLKLLFHKLGYALMENSASMFRLNGQVKEERDYTKILWHKTLLVIDATATYYRCNQLLLSNSQLLQHGTTITQHYIVRSWLSVTCRIMGSTTPLYGGLHSETSLLYVPSPLDTTLKVGDKGSTTRCTSGRNRKSLHCRDMLHCTSECSLDTCHSGVGTANSTAICFAVSWLVLSTLRKASFWI